MHVPWLLYHNLNKKVYNFWGTSFIGSLTIKYFSYHLLRKKKSFSKKDEHRKIKYFVCKSQTASFYNKGDKIKSIKISKEHFRFGFITNPQKVIAKKKTQKMHL